MVRWGSRGHGDGAGGATAADEGFGGSGRRWGRRVLRLMGAVVTVVLVVVVGWVGWFLWVAPPPYRVPLPEGVAEGETLVLNSSTEGVFPSSKDGFFRVSFGELRLESRRWVGEITISSSEENSIQRISLRLGQSSYVDGLGTLTLIGVDPRVGMPWADQEEGVGKLLFLNINPDPGVTLGYPPTFTQDSPTSDGELGPEQEEG